ncbi:long-chain-fatty-acid--CoA ligase [Colwellia sp. MEBiC06753]
MSTAKTINQFIDQALAENNANVAFTCLGKDHTFAEIDEKSKNMASWLTSQGLQKGDRIAIQLPNLVQFPIAFYGAIRAGLTVVNLNPMYTPEEMKAQINDSGAKAIIILTTFCDKLEAIKNDVNLDLVVVTDPADMLTEQLDVSCEYTGFNHALKQGADLEYVSVTAEENDVCILQYTGGTTGVSKGACLTHKNMLSNRRQVFERLQTKILPNEETLVCPLPLYHIYALQLSLFVFAGAGCSTLLIPNPSDVDAFLGALENKKFTAFAGINTLFVGLSQHPKFKAFDFSALKLTVSGGSTLTSSAAAAWSSVTGCSITEGYGLSETSPVVCLNIPGSEEIGAVGPACQDTEIKLFDKENKEVADGEAGELYVRGPQVMVGYWNKPEETSKAINADGFFATGDMAVKLENGNYKIVDRIKDMIIVSGFNVYPNQVEDVIAAHPKVIEVAVIGESDAKTGEKVVAYITVNAELSDSELIDFCRQKLTSYKVPKKIVIVDELPKSSVGKILRRKLRD